MKRLSQKQTPEELDFSYQTIEAFKASFDRALANPELSGKVFSELLSKFGILFEAVIILVEHEHRQVLYEMVRSYLGLMKEWAKNR